MKYLKMILPILFMFYTCNCYIALNWNPVHWYATVEDRLFTIFMLVIVLGVPIAFKELENF